MHHSFTLAICLLYFITTRGLGKEQTCADGECKEEGEENIYTSTSHDGSSDDGRPPCPDPPPGLGDIEVDMITHTLDWINKQYPDVQPGGLWEPPCRAKQKIAIVVPYRNRQSDLKIFLLHMHKYLQWQLLEYGIYLVEQADKKHFNRGHLLNIAYTHAMREKQYDCVVLHDVDKYPEDTRNIYTCDHRPRHLIGQQKYFGQNYRERPYEKYFGGVTIISSKQFKLINGFSNMFWGWGSEDDDFLKRVDRHGLIYSRSPDDIGRYVETYQGLGFVNPRRHEVVKEGMARYDTDGLNSMDYKVVKETKKPLYTHITVELLNKDPYL